MNTVLRRFGGFFNFLSGLVFFVSGLLKLMDPIGTKLIVEEYFKFFNINFLRDFSVIVAYIIAFTEVFIGVAVLTKIRRNVVAAITTVVLLFFTTVTLILFIKNPSMDCGCFGEAIHLTHLQSLIKNIVLLAFIFVAFILDNRPPTKKKKWVFGLIMASVIGFAAYSHTHLPLMDFTNFKPASQLSYESSSQSTFNEDDYTVTFIYEKNGKSGVFTLDRMPDSTWTYVRTENILKDNVMEQKNAPILSFRDNSGTYCDSLAFGDNVIVCSVYDVDELSGEQYSKIKKSLLDAGKAGMMPLLLIAGTPDYFSNVLAKKGISPDVLKNCVYMADYTTLITMNRSNGGFTYLNNGIIVRKWSFRQMPEFGEVKWLHDMDESELVFRSFDNGPIIFQAFVAYVLFVMLFL